MTQNRPLARLVASSALTLGVALATTASTRTARADAVGYRIIENNPNKYNMQYDILAGWGGGNLKSASLAADVYWRPLGFLAIQGSTQIPVLTGGRAFFTASGGLFLHFPVGSNARVQLNNDGQTITYVDIPEAAISRWGLDGGFITQRNGFSIGPDDDVGAKSVGVYGGIHWRKQADFTAEVDGYGARGNLSLLDVYAHVVQSLSLSYDLPTLAQGTDPPKEHKYGARVGASASFAHTAGFAMKAEAGVAPGPANGGFYFFVGAGFAGGAAL